jgi:hypothetical protein
MPFTTRRPPTPRRTAKQHRISFRRRLEPPHSGNATAWGAIPGCRDRARRAGGGRRPARPPGLPGLPGSLSGWSPRRLPRGGRYRPAARSATSARGRSPAGRRGFVRCSSSSTRRARSRLWAAAPPRRSTPVTRQAGTPSTTWGADRCGKPAHPGRGMVAVSDCLCPARSVFAGARRTRAEPIRLTAAFDDDPAFLSQASRAGLPAPGLQSRASCAGAS